MTASGTFSSARNVRSTTAPVRHVLELGAHERAALARLHVLELDDGDEALDGRFRAMPFLKSLVEMLTGRSQFR